MRTTSAGQCIFTKYSIGSFQMCVSVCVNEVALKESFKE